MALPSDSNTLIQWKLDESPLATTFANSGSGGALNLIQASSNYYGISTTSVSPAPSPSQANALECNTSNFPNSSYENHLVTSTPLGSAGTTIGEVGASITVSFFVNLLNYTGGVGGTSQYGVMVCKCGDPTNVLALGWQVVLNPPDNGEWYIGASFGGTSQYFGSETASELPLAAWSHIGFTYDGTTVTRYKDGVVAGTYTPAPAGAINYGTHGAYNVGGGMNNGGNNIDGFLSDIRVEQVVRSASWFRGMALSSLAVTPSSDTILVSGTVALAVTATYLDGHTDTATTDVAWTTSDPTVAMVSSGGLVTGIGLGNATITATWGANASGPIQATCAITVGGVLQSITVEPPLVGVVPTEIVGLSAIGHYEGGDQRDLTALAAWSSADGAVATAASDGVVTGVAVGGPVDVTATYGGFSGVGAVLVVPSLTWPMPLPALDPPACATAGSEYAPFSPVDRPVPLYHDEAAFLALAARVLPDWYLQPLQQQGSGYELLQGYAKLFERVSRAVGLTQVSAFAHLAGGGCPATASVEFFRRSLGTGAFTVSAGTVVGTSKSGRYYATQADVSFGVDDYYVGALALSVGQGDEYNVPGPLVLPDGTRLPGEIDTVVTPMLVPVFAEPHLEVRQVADAHGGQAPVLDQHGDDRGIDRGPGESDPAYKARVNKLPDTVSPAAIRRHLDAVLVPLGIPYELIETWSNTYQSCWNAPLGTATNPTMGELAEGTWAWNDPRDDAFRGRWMSVDDTPAGYVVVFPTLPAFGDRGYAWNDPALDASGLRTNFGLRATGAWNAPLLDGGTYLAGCWNGGDVPLSTLYASLWALLRSIKGGGVGVKFVVAAPDQADIAPAVAFLPA